MRARSRRSQQTRRIGAGPVGAGLIGLALLLALPLARRYGRMPAARFAATASGAILAQQALVAHVAKHQAAGGEPDRLSPVDLMACGRGATAALLAGLTLAGVRDRRGLAGWIGWLALTGGSIALDWLDGPIARRLGTSRAGAAYDLEADSWLTLSAAMAATAWGGLPAYCIGPPALRYVLLARALRRVPYAEVFASEPRWARWTGISQMLLLTAALAPFGGRATGRAVRLAAPVVAPIQAAAMLATLGSARR